MGTTSERPGSERQESESLFLTTGVRTTESEQYIGTTGAGQNFSKKFDILQMRRTLNHDHYYISTMIFSYTTKTLSEGKVWTGNLRI